MYDDRVNNIKVRTFSFNDIHRLRHNDKDLLLCASIYVLVSLCICVNIRKCACTMYVTVLRTLSLYRSNRILQFSVVLKIPAILKLRVK